MYVNALVLRDQVAQTGGPLGGRFYVQQDANWNVTALVDASGNVVERYDYLPYGAVTVLTPSWSVQNYTNYSVPYLWQGMEYEWATNLYFSDTRVYSPTLMAWLQTDPIGLNAGNNDLEMEGDGPTDALDPSGLEPVVLPVVASSPWWAPFVANPWTGPIIVGVGGSIWLGVESVSWGVKAHQGAQLEAARQQLLQRRPDILAPPKMGPKQEPKLEPKKKDAPIDIDVQQKQLKACFAAGTMLYTPQGYRAIESLRVGDLVFSRAEEDSTSEISAKKVEEVFVHTGRIWILTVNGREIRTTGEHPFWVRDRGWVNACELVEENRLLSHDGQWAVVEAIEDTNKYETVYNLRIADYHTYFVGGDEWGFSVWAHNECFYRAMSEKECATVIAAQKLSRRERGSNNLAVTQDRAYAESLVDRRNGARKYPRVVEIETKEGTALALIAMGAAHNSAALLFPNNPAWSDVFPVQLKLEKGGVLSYLLYNDAGVAFFNSTIISIRTIR